MGFEQWCSECNKRVSFKPTCSNCGATLIPENLKPEEKKMVGIPKGRRKTGRNKQASHRNRKNKKNKKSKKSVIDPVPRPGYSVLEKYWFDKKVSGSISREIENLAKNGTDQDLITIICASRIENKNIEKTVLGVLERFGYERINKIVYTTHPSPNWSENIRMWLAKKEGKDLQTHQLPNFDGSESKISGTAVKMNAFKAGETSVERSEDHRKYEIVQELRKKADKDQPALVELVCAMRDEQVERVVKLALADQRIGWRKCKKVYEDFPHPNWPSVFTEWLTLQEEADRKRRLEKRQKDSIMPGHEDYGVADI